MKQRSRRETAAVLQDMRSGTEDLDLEYDDREKLLAAMEELLKALRACNFGDETDPNLLQVRERLMSSRNFIGISSPIGQSSFGVCSVHHYAAPDFFLQVKLTANSAELIERWRLEKDENRDVCHVHNTCPCMCCWDETDDGIPPCCKTEEDDTIEEDDDSKPVPCWQVFNENNIYTNSGTLCWLFGTVGFQIFDKRRRAFMGIAMWTTLVSMLFTFVGALAYSNNKTLLYGVAWFQYEIVNTTAPEKSIVAYMGLQSMMVVEQPCDPVNWCKEEL